MKALQKILIIALGAGVTACSSPVWPPERGGGMAEHAPNFHYVNLVNEEDQTREILLERVQFLEEGLEALVFDGARIYAAAETTLAETLTFRIRREIAGNLFAEAEKDLISLRERLERIHNRVYWTELDEDTTNL